MKQANKQAMQLASSKQLHAPRQITAAEMGGNVSIKGGYLQKYNQ